MDVRAIRPDEGLAYREVRLRALRLAPASFGATLAEEARLPESHWRDLIASIADGGYALYVLERGEGAPLAGTVYARMEREPALGYVGAMWVDEDLRGGGWADRLLEAAEAWLRDQGAAGVHLWMSRGNEPAWRFYSRRGYQPTGVTEPIPSGEALELYRRFG